MGAVAWLLIAGACGGTQGFPAYQKKIPSGQKVKRGDAWWPGVGHLSQYGGGERNVFGLDFAAAGMTWTAELCRKDSDGDGQSNGLELGDPNCVWSQGSVPERTEDLSHPGFRDSTTQYVHLSVTPGVVSVTPPSPASPEGDRGAAPTPEPATTSAVPEVAPAPAPAGDELHAGATVYLRAGTGRFIDAEDGFIQARWETRDARQAFRIEREEAGVIHSGDTVFLRAASGNPITVQGNKTTDPPLPAGSLHTLWHHSAAWQALVITKRDGEGTVHIGDAVFFRGHTGHRITVEGDTVHARAADNASVQELVLEADGPATGGSTRRRRRQGGAKLVPS